MSEKFDSDFPYYLSIGMSATQYWDEDPWLVSAYRKAEEIRQARMDNEAWLQGMYVYDAICCCVPVLRAFSKATKPSKYPDKPYSTVMYEQKVEEQASPEEQMDKGLQSMMAWAAKVNSKMQSKGVTNNADVSVGDRDTE